MRKKKQKLQTMQKINKQHGGQQHLILKIYIYKYKAFKESENIRIFSIYGLSFFPLDSFSNP